MFLKIAGAMLVIAASAFIGITLASGCRKRPRQLADIAQLLGILENEISFMASMLDEALLKCAEAGTTEAAALFRAAGEKLRAGAGISAAEAWKKAVSENAGTLALSAEDNEILGAFGSTLGCTDTDGQIRNIRHTLTRLAAQHKKAEEERAKSEKMYRSLGLAGGATVILLFI